MGFIRRTLEYAVGRSLSEAINKAVRQVAAPKAAQYQNSGTQNYHSMHESAEYQDNPGSAASDLDQSMNNPAAPNLLICPECEKPSSSDKKFCPYCGTKLPEPAAEAFRTCASCRNQNSAGAKFCTVCGTKLESSLPQENTYQKYVPENDESE